MTKLTDSLMSFSEWTQEKFGAVDSWCNKLVNGYYVMFCLDEEGQVVNVIGKFNVDKGAFYEYNIDGLSVDVRESYNRKLRESYENKNLPYTVQPIS